MKFISILTLSLVLACSCSTPQDKAIAKEQIEQEIDAGNFAGARYLIDLYITHNNLTDSAVYELNRQKDLMNRIQIDFGRDKEWVKEYISKYYPDVTDKDIDRWVADKTLEAMVIDGQIRYFNRGAANLFRLDKDAIARKAEVDGVTEDDADVLLKTHLSGVVNEVKKTGKTQAKPVGMKVKYRVTLKPNSVPDGEVVRCWLPYPRQDERRQTAVELLSVDGGNYIISPPEYAHTTLYMEKTARRDEPLSFAVEFGYRSAAEWFDLESKDLEPYDTSSDLYKSYTAERPPHVVFTDSIKAVSERVIGDETRPYGKVKRIFGWINDNFPWAGAREYSTLANIPQYVLENHHGDCGQVSLLFITLARYNGIPARWQSGFMMHPGELLGMHDWAEYYIEGVGWIPIDQSLGNRGNRYGQEAKDFFASGIDAYRWIVNNDYSQPLYPAKIYPRSETVDFQRGELEWKGGNLYFDKWKWDFDVEYVE